jgi:hypothetical protein
MQRQEASALPLMRLAAIVGMQFLENVSEVVFYRECADSQYSSGFRGCFTQLHPTHYLDFTSTQTIIFAAL